jgi:putative ABC transport system ATP-binding protein
MSRGRHALGSSGSLISSIEALAAVDGPDRGLTMELRDAARQHRVNGHSVPMLDNINLRFDDGKLLSMLETSGASKSTLLRLLGAVIEALAGLDPPDRGLTIELHDVVRQYLIGDQQVRALDNVNLKLEGGQFVSVVGPSGAGKSTLLHLLGALDSPDSGSITFDGEEIGRLGDAQQSEFRHHRVGFVFQFFNLLPTLSAWENVAIPKLLDGVRLGKAKPDAVRLLERVGLGNRTEHRPSEMSGGQMQRVAVARALMMDPPLILADEPTGNLDSTTGASILELLAEVAHEEGRGRLVVMVTHNPEAAKATDRIITLQDGRVGSDESLLVPC